MDSPGWHLSGVLSGVHWLQAVPGRGEPRSAVCFCFTNIKNQAQLQTGRMQEQQECESDDEAFVADEEGVLGEGGQVVAEYDEDVGACCFCLNRV